MTTSGSPPAPEVSARPATAAAATVIVRARNRRSRHRIGAIARTAPVTRSAPTTSRTHGSTFSELPWTALTSRTMTATATRRRVPVDSTLPLPMRRCSSPGAARVRAASGPMFQHWRPRPGRLPSDWSQNGPNGPSSTPCWPARPTVHSHRSGPVRSVTARSQADRMPLLAAVSRSARALLDLALPDVCAACDRPPGPLCPGCEAALWSEVFERPRRCTPDPAPPGLPPVVAVGPYAGVLRRLVSAYKDDERRDLRPLLARLLSRSLADAVGTPPRRGRPDAVVAGGRAPTRRRPGARPGPRRDASRLHGPARPLASVVPALRPVRRLADQSRLDRRQRARNLAGAYAVAPRWAGALVGVPGGAGRRRRHHRVHPGGGGAGRARGRRPRRGRGHPRRDASAHRVPGRNRLVNRPT